MSFPFQMYTISHDHTPPTHDRLANRPCVVSHSPFLGAIETAQQTLSHSCSEHLCHFNNIPNRSIRTYEASLDPPFNMKDPTNRIKLETKIQIVRLTNSPCGQQESLENSHFLPC